MEKLDCYLLLEDLFNQVPTKDLELLFDLLETQVRIADDRMEQQALIRISNFIIKKLGATQDMKFKGRVLKMIAENLPLQHRSGLNVQGKFSQPPPIALDPQPVNNRDSLHPGMGQEEMEDDYRDYTKFWSLQTHLTNPLKTCETSMVKGGEGETLLLEVLRTI